MNLIRGSLRLKYTIPRGGFEGDLSTPPGGGHPASPASRRLKPSSPSSHTVSNKQPRNSNVVTTEGRPIKGLYAAGEIAGGVHGNQCCLFRGRGGGSIPLSQYPPARVQYPSIPSNFERFVLGCIEADFCKYN